MNRSILLVPVATLLLLSGCGKPLPERLDPENQLRVELGWNAAFAPVGRLDHQGLLDVMIGTRIYEYGVDSLIMKSEKHFDAGKAVMEVYYERNKPELDRFTVSIYDHGGKLLRSDSYDRREVESTHHDLTGQALINATEKERAVKTAEREARLNRVKELFPDPPK